VKTLHLGAVYLLLSRRQNAAQNHDIKRANRSFENVTHFRYLGKAVTNQNINLNYWVMHPVARVSSRVMLATTRSRAFCLLVCCSKNVKIRIHKIIILPMVLYGCETWSLTLREKHKSRNFENRVLRIIF
jgi:hypothetical protein